MMADEGKNYVNHGTEEQMEISGYHLHRGKRLLVWLGYLLTAGFLKLLFYWLPHFKVWMMYDECNLGHADCILLQNSTNQKFVSEVENTTSGGTSIKIKRPHKKLFQKKSPYSIENADPEKDASIIRFFTCKKVKYVWNAKTCIFTPFSGLDEGHALSYFHNAEGLTRAEQNKRRAFSGANIIEVHVTPIVVLLFREVLSPFYIFQLFSMGIWYADEYELYATCIVVISCVSITLTVYQTRTFERALRNTITSTTMATVCRGGEEYENVSSVDLVPGDVIEIPRHGCDMQCDAVLITGNCIVNESMLTGESIPVTKTSLPNPTGMTGQNDPVFDMKQHSRHVLFCGTRIIQTRFYGNQKVKAVVVRTGFSTSKGELVRAIMFPKPLDFKFQRHSYYFVLFLAGLAGLGFIYTIVIMVQDGDNPSDIVLRTLDLITIAVPPALPAALAVGVVFSQRRLKDQKIYCISPKGINICGTISTVCFDKTGTLTEDGLDMHGVVKADQARFGKIEREVSHLPKGPLLTAMATCHSLTIIDNDIVGDPLDVIMFEATKWDLEEPGPDETRFDMMVPTIVRPKTKTLQKQSAEHHGDDLQGEDVGIVRQFPFSSSLQRMSVITRQLEALNFILYVKGSPEMITSLCKSETVPIDFHEKLESYTRHGYRVIALAWKPLPAKLNYVKAQRINRESLENELTFLGLLVMENRVKPQTSPVIANLINADIRTVMVTGDNMLTALSVARECGMVDATDRIILVQAYPPVGNRSDEITVDFVYADDKDTQVEEVFAMEDHRLQIDDNQRFHFAMTGKTWGVIYQHCSDLLDKLVVRGLVFARMSPEQKGQLVEVLQNVGYYVGMCGDGANDCGALKAAHMGISLSEAEASVASPFTSKIATIECVPKVIKEGRAALVTSFGVFKYIACYSLTQFTSVLILYWIGTNLTDGEFLYVDIFLILSFSVTFSRTAPYESLVKERPLVSLLSPSPLLSIITQTALCIIAQTLAFWNVQEQSWFVPFVETEDEVIQCHQNTAVFIMSSYLYIVFAISFSKAAPFRRSLFTNWWFLGNVIVAVAVNIWITVYPTQGVADIMELELFPSIRYRAVYVGFGLACFLVSYLMETFIVDNEYIRRRARNGLCKCIPVSDIKYKALESEMDNNPDWPPVSDVKVDLAEIFQRLDRAHMSPSDLQPPKTLPLEFDGGDDQMADDDGDSISETDRQKLDVSSSLHENALFKGKADLPSQNSTADHPSVLVSTDNTPSGLVSTEGISTKM